MTQRIGAGSVPPRGTAARRRWSVAWVSAAIVAAGALGGAGWTLADDGTDSPAVQRSEQLQRAEQRLIHRCMAEHGFRYVEQVSTPTEPDFPYMVDDVGWAREHGYGTLLAGPDAGEGDANAVHLQSLAPDRQRAWQRTLLGSGRQLTVEVPDLGRVQAPDNGCTADSRRALYGDLAAWYRVRRVVDHLGIYVSNAVTADPRYRTALGAWARCVRQHGYDAASPEALRAQVVEQTRGLAAHRAHQREVAVAEVEAGCATSTSFPRTIRDLERKYRPEIERRFHDQRTELREFEADAARRAERILADS